MNNNYYCVILAGGIGSRLWPSSQPNRPKQFIDFLGTGQSLLQTTYQRFLQFIPRENIIVMSQTEYADIVVSQLPDLPEGNLLLEPRRRDTVPSVAWASIEIMRRVGEEGCLTVTPSDQVIADPTAFHDCVLKGMDYVANTGRMLSLGVVPTHPATCYGYVQMGENAGPDIFRVQSFTEKPEREFAEMFVDSGEFLWNSGLFIARASSFVNRILQQGDIMAQILGAAEAGMMSGKIESRQLEDVFAKCPNVSLEKGILEMTEGIDVMKCNFGWNDIGSWQALYDVLPRNDAQDNVIMASDTRLIDCKRCLVHLPEGKKALIDGLEDYLVVEEGDVLIICRRDNQSVIRNFRLSVE